MFSTTPQVPTHTLRAKLEVVSACGTSYTAENKQLCFLPAKGSKMYETKQGTVQISMTLLCTFS